MLKLENILEEWTKDCNIDEARLSSEIVGIPKLHAKYIRHLNDHKLASIKAKIDYDKLKNLLTEYYNGNLDKETLDELGWEQFDLKLMKSGVERYINSDERLNKLLYKKSYHDQVASTCEQILNELKNRTWQLKTVVDYNKFLSGS
jgi:hypothetical protein